MKKYFSIVFALSFVALPAAGDGFKVKDLLDVQIDHAAFIEGEYYSKDTSATRIKVVCEGCEDVSIDFTLGRSEDGTEGRYRSGETTIEKMEGICQKRNNSCTLSAIAVGDAVGWISTYTTWGLWGSTAILFLDGDLLTIRSFAAEAEVTNRNVATALEVVAPLMNPDLSHGHAAFVWRRSDVDLPRSWQNN